MRRLPEGYTLTRADAADIADLIAIQIASDTLFAGTGLVAETALDDHIPEDLLASAVAARHVFIARDDTQGWPVGFTLTSERGSTLYLDQVSVHPDHGRRGIGRALVARVIDDARDRGLKSVTLSTFRDVAWNGPFYRKLGFREIPPAKRADWMNELEALQAETLDVSKRCFMRRRARLF